MSEIRAVLLAALRSAVLWRQLGGSFWDFVLRTARAGGRACSRNCGCERGKGGRGRAPIRHNYGARSAHSAVAPRFAAPTRMTPEPSMADSFATRAQLDVNGKSLTYLQPAPPRAALRPGQAAVLAEDPAREPAALRRRRQRHARRHRSGRQLGRRRRSRTPKSPSCRRAWCCRTSPACPAWSTSPRCARRCVQLGGDRQADQSADPVRTGHRPLGAGRRLTARADALRPNGKIEFERNMRALQLPALGPEGVPQLQGRAAEHRHRAPGEPRDTSARVVVDAKRHRRRRTAGVPGHRGRHRLAHHDDQRPRRARLGRRRHRSRSRDARPARHRCSSRRSSASS